MKFFDTDELFSFWNTLTGVYPINEIGKNSKELENPVLSIGDVKRMINKRLRQLRYETNVFVVFMHESHLIEFKV